MNKFGNLLNSVLKSCANFWTLLFELANEKKLFRSFICVSTRTIWYCLLLYISFETARGWFWIGIFFPELESQHMYAIKLYKTCPFWLLKVLETNVNAATLLGSVKTYVYILIFCFVLVFCFRCYKAGNVLTKGSRGAIIPIVNILTWPTTQI